MAEIDVIQDAFIVSETDKNGLILKVNQYFKDISGYDESELIGQDHNILRHSDMPKATFMEMWRFIKSGQTWRGFIKNKCKNGDYYWSYAIVSPVDRLDRNASYICVRQKCTKLEAKKFQEKYDLMRKEESKEESNG